MAKARVPSGETRSALKAAAQHDIDTATQALGRGEIASATDRNGKTRYVLWASTDS